MPWPSLMGAESSCCVNGCRRTPIECAHVRRGTDGSMRESRPIDGALASVGCITVNSIKWGKLGLRGNMT